MVPRSSSGASEFLGSTTRGAPRNSEEPEELPGGDPDVLRELPQLRLVGAGFLLGVEPDADAVDGALVRRAALDVGGVEAAVDQLHGQRFRRPLVARRQ